MAFGVLETIYPDPEKWDYPAFERLRELELCKLRAELADYDRKSFFGENPYYRYFKKYKKTYPVMQQLESWLLKGRPFPTGNPINEVVFLAELCTRMLLGAHDIGQMRGVPELFCPDAKLPFTGLRGDEVHTYPGDISGRDEEGIILSMIAGADNRTCIHDGSFHLAYLFFGAPGVSREEIETVQERLSGYIRVLAPSAQLNASVIGANPDIIR